MLCIGSDVMTLPPETTSGRLFCYLKSNARLVIMISIGLDLGTGFVKCVYDFREIRFPSLYASKIISDFSSGKKLIWNMSIGKQ